VGGGDRERVRGLERGGGKGGEGGGRGKCSNHKKSFADAIDSENQKNNSGGDPKKRGGGAAEKARNGLCSVEDFRRGLGIFRKKSQKHINTEREK